MYHFYLIKFQFLTDSTDFKSHVNAKQKILLLTYAKFAYMQNLRICKSLPCVQGFRLCMFVVVLRFEQTT